MKESIQKHKYNKNFSILKYIKINSTLKKNNKEYKKVKIFDFFHKFPGYESKQQQQLSKV